MNTLSQWQTAGTSSWPLRWAVHWELLEGGRQYGAVKRALDLGLGGCRLESPFISFMN